MGKASLGKGGIEKCLRGEEWIGSVVNMILRFASCISNPYRIHVALSSFGDWAQAALGTKHKASHRECDRRGSYTG